MLRKIAETVPDDFFGTSKLTKIIASMTEALDKALDGVALAAPQIGISYRIFIVRYDRTLPPEKDVAQKPEIGIYINPKIIKTSRRRANVEEGCLSVRGVYGHLHRYERTTVSAQHEDGSHFTRGGGSILAQIFQHEIDHLNGALFIDYAKDLYEITPEDEGSSGTNTL